MKTPPNSSEEVDDERATRKTNPFVDHGLGLVLILLILRFCHYAATNEGPVLLHALIAFALTLFAIYSVRWFAHAVGQALSNYRDHDGIPDACRRPLASRVAQKKWKDQAWQLAIHVSMTLWEIRLISAHPQWWEDPSAMYTPCPETLKRDGIPDAMMELRWYYVMQLVLWMWTGVSCKWLEERRKDYVEMMLHHVMTVALVLSSFMESEFAIGLVVLLIHDASDIVLDCMKMANYLKVEGPHGGFMTEILFVLNTYVVWPYLRMYRFPVYIIPAIYGDYPDRCGTKEVPWPGTSKGFTLLSALFLLHCFWWMLLNKIAWKLIKGQDPNKVGDEEYEYTMKDKAS